MTTKLLVGTAIELSFNPDKEYRVSEPSLMAILELLQDAPGLLTAFTDAPKSDSDEDQLAAILKVLTSAKFRNVFYKFLAAVLSCSTDEVKECRTSDFLKILKVLKDEVDWEDLKETFFHVVTKENLSKIFPRLMSQEETSGQ